MQLLAYPRDSYSLDGTWQAIPDQYEMFRDYFDDFVEDDDGESAALPDDDGQPALSFESIYEPSASGSDDITDFNIYDGYSVDLPASWGEEIPEFRHFEGWVWFARTFDRDEFDEDDRTFLRFGAVNYKAEVWLNGEQLGDHEGGYTPFSFEITDELQDGENVIVVRMDNSRYEDGIPNESTDWYNFGGINRSVDLVSVPESHLRNFKVETSLADDGVNVQIDAWLDGPDTGADGSVALPELGVDEPLASDGDGRLSAEFTIERDDVTLWSPEKPQLYDIELTYGDDAITDRVGLREIEVQGSDVLVNGEKVWLRGIALHEEAAGKGRALDTEDVQTRFQWINELGCNFARLAHYPHTEEMARTADEEGILLWEEVPAYWDVNFGDEDVQELYRQQLRELIQRDWNRASVALWSIANETDHNDETRNEVLPQMADYVRELDDTRLVTAACFVDETDDGIVLQDPLEEHLDVVGVNEYYGWYYGDANDLEDLQEDTDGTPIVISETGGGAKWGNHGTEEDRWTEEFQAEIYRGQIEGASTNDQIAGMSPWILFDFRAPMRQNEYQRGYNRKGVVDQHGRKKRAFHVLREFYESEKL
ncbi:beta galactosidase jelly roll domain-containing protein [Haloterrigena sp. SYSU A121-1]|uniref:Beta galactosidase jelly roll domain-containing protein n=1 Tax=Haloterrigena gelatinilytica TaxID=2741724 RepID=A0A8J8KHR7_9EURY|nr:glycoside hydrolase family 2 TIM barrel-domain containing protein [Haloterrigena gelatinilytica]NUB93776.1 beta galactosidase jelly roll domain-containing protein [Haloterrigena gelatinilytica]